MLLYFRFRTEIIVLFVFLVSFLTYRVNRPSFNDSYIGVEFSECLAFFAIAKNLVTYLTGALHESNVDAATTVSTWIGSSFFTPLIGAFFADTFWGRYWTLLIFLSVYVIVSSYKQCGNMQTADSICPFKTLNESILSGDDHPDSFSLSSPAHGLIV